MKWFKHDSTATTDAKVKKLVLRFGPEGYAVYFHCLELVAGDVTNEKITFELEHDAEVIAHNLNFKSSKDLTAIDKVNSIMLAIIDLGLFETDSSKVFCYKLAKRLDSSLIKNPKLKEIKNNIDQNVQISDNSRLNKKTTVRLDKIRLDKTRSDKNKPYTDSFIDLWKVYPNTAGKKSCSMKYESLIKKGIDPNELLQATLNYAKTVIDKEMKFIKQGKTFFGPGEHWKEFMIEQDPDQKYTGPKTSPAIFDANYFKSKGGNNE